MFKKLQKILLNKSSADLIRVSDIDNFVTRDALIPFKFIIRGSHNGESIDKDFMTLRDTREFILDLPIDKEFA